MTLADCGRVNLLVGRNNSGKTSALEALALLCRPDDLEWWIDTVWSREVKSARTPEREVIKMLFPRFGAGLDDELFTGGMKLGATLRALDGIQASRILEAQFREEKIATRDLDYYRAARADGSSPLPPPDFGELHTSIAARLSVALHTGKNELVGLWHQFSENGALPYPTPKKEHHIPSGYVTTVTHRTESLADRLGEALVKDRRPDRREALLRLLQAFQPTLTNFEIVSRPRQGPQVWLEDSRAGWLPIAVAGDGIRRAFHFAVAAVGAQGGVLLVDEIESALHKEALGTVFGFLMRECVELDVQMFATTHSLEALDAIMEQCGNDDASLVVHGLSPTGAQRTSLSELKIIREEHGFDIR